MQRCLCPHRQLPRPCHMVLPLFVLLLHTWLPSERDENERVEGYTRRVWIQTRLDSSGSTLYSLVSFLTSLASVCDCLARNETIDKEIRSRVLVSLVTYNYCSQSSKHTNICYIFTSLNPTSTDCNPPQGLVRSICTTTSFLRAPFCTHGHWHPVLTGGTLQWGWTGGRVRLASYVCVVECEPRLVDELPRRQHCTRWISPVLSCFFACLPGCHLDLDLDCSLLDGMVS
jgi:hypothetical protein